MFKKILLVLALLVALIIIVSRFQPATWHVERSGDISAPPEAVFDQLTDFHGWARFNPWNDLDSNMVLSYSGAERGVGAKYHWAGNSNAGKGEMTITEARPNEYVKIGMHFIEPMDGTAITEFIIRPGHGGSNLTWAMTGEHSSFSRIICLFTSMDRMMGSELEKGISRLDRVFTGR